MKDLHTSQDRGQEQRDPVKFSNSQKALNPELYFAHVARDTDLFTKSEKVPCRGRGWSFPIAVPASGIDCRRNLFAPAYLSSPESMNTIQSVIYFMICLYLYNYDHEIGGTMSGYGLYL